MNRLHVSAVLVFLIFTASPARSVVYQVGAFEDPANRRVRVEQLQNLGFKVDYDTSPGGLTRVRTTELTPDRARRLRDQLRERDIGFFPVDESPTRSAEKSPRPSNDETIVPRQRVEQALGTRYRWGGESLQTGFDCSGLLTWLLPAPDLPRTVQSLRAWSQPVPRSKVRRGDFVFFGFESSTADHVGLVTGSDTFVHASRSKGVIFSDLERDHYQKQILGYGRRPPRKSGVR